MTERTMVLLAIIASALLGVGCSQQNDSNSGSATPATPAKQTTFSPASGKLEPHAEPVKVTPIQGVPPRAPD